MHLSWESCQVSQSNPLTSTLRFKTGTKASQCIWNGPYSPTGFEKHFKMLYPSPPALLQSCPAAWLSSCWSPQGSCLPFIYPPIPTGSVAHRTTQLVVPHCLPWFLRKGLNKLMLTGMSRKGLQTSLPKSHMKFDEWSSDVLKIIWRTPEVLWQLAGDAMDSEGVPA